MNYLIGMLLPSVLGYRLFIHVNKHKHFSNEDKICYFLLLILFSNLVNGFISRMLFGIKGSIENLLTSYVSFSIRYILISIALNIALVFLISFIKERVSLSIKIEKKEKNEKKNK